MLTRTHPLILVHTCTHAHSRALTCVITCMHTHAQSHGHTHSFSQTRAHMHAHKHAHTRTHNPTHVHTHNHSHTHSCMHTLTCTRLLTITHMHVDACPLTQCSHARTHTKFLLVVAVGSVSLLMRQSPYVNCSPEGSLLVL